MNSNFTLTRKLTFTPVTGYSPFNVVAGAPAWVDTDVSSVTGTNPKRLWLVNLSLSGAQLVGIRAHGASQAPEGYAFMTNYFTYVDSTGHIDVLRNAASTVSVSFLGYFE